MAGETMTDVVPLPDILGTCGCRYAPRRHATTCKVAIEFDEAPREFVLGQRYAAVSWDYPLRLTAEVRVEVELDPIALIVNHYADEYAAFDDQNYDPAEKPMAFLHHLIEEGVEFMGLRGNRRVAWDRCDVEEVREYPAWTDAHTERLNEALVNRVVIDPNQGTLI